MAALELVISCEHGGHRVPPAYRSLFAGQGALLRSHRGWDPGALLVARALARALDAPLIAATTTRLLVDLNRSPHNPRVFSKTTRALPREARAALLERHHRPHWDRLRAALARRDTLTVHVAVHSFTPVWEGRRRPITVGLLYDPKRARERRFALRWKQQLARAPETHPIRRNAPYRGDADGLTTAMRRERPASRYLGLELELDQADLADAGRRRRLVTTLGASLRAVCDGFVPR